MEIIPAIDIIGGKCVRLRQGDYADCQIYSSVPLDVAKEFESVGLKRLHLVDLDGAKNGRVMNLKVLEAICSHTTLEVDFGGGIKSETDVSNIFAAGARFVCIGSIAQTDPVQINEWFDRFGSDRMIIGADVLDTKICINGWKKVTDTTIFQLIENYGGKLSRLMCTDITKDGMLEGPGIKLYEELLVRYPDLHLIASGGVSGRDDLCRLKDLGVTSVIVGKAIYEQKIKLKDLLQWD